MTYRVLLITQEQHIETDIKSKISATETELTVARDLKEGQSLLQLQDFSLLILDADVGSVDLLGFVQDFRQHNITPLIVLSGNDDVFDLILALELGVDDYLIKPFNSRELVARTKALLRRVELYSVASNSASLISRSQITINPKSREVTYCEQELNLTSVEFDILHILMRRAGQLVSRKTLSEEVLGRNLSPYERSVDVHICKIRKKLQEVSPGDKFKTVRGLGYIFTAA